MGNKTILIPDFVSKVFLGVPANDIYLPISSYRFEGTDIVVKEFSSAGDSSLESRFNIANVVYSIRPEKKIIERNGGLFFETSSGEVAEESINDMQKIIEGQYLVEKKFILGTDRFGRDVFSRLLTGTRVTMLVGVISVLISLIIGFFVGFLAGIFRGKIDQFILWIINVAWSVPAFLLVIVISIVFGKGFIQTFIAVGCTLWVPVAQIVRAKILNTYEKEYISSAHELGISKVTIFFRHILPPGFAPVLIVAVANFSASILIESGLDFLSIGVQSVVPTWGGMIKENFGYIMTSGSAYLTILPGLAIILVSMALTFVGNGLRTAFDSQQQVSVQ